MIRTSLARNLFHTVSAVLTLVAAGRADDSVLPPLDPQPLFAPDDSIRLLPPGEVAGAEARIQSKEELYQRLRQSLLDLEARLQAQQQSISVPEPAANDTVPENVVVESDVAADASAAPDDSSSDADHAPMPSPTTPMEEPLIHQEPTQEESHVESVPAEPVTHPAPTELPATLQTQGTPNLAALADNLYALGEYELAYGTYGELNQSELQVEEQIWVTYQMAGCLRHLEQSEEAARLYRQLLADYPDHDLASVSRWWLDAMEADSQHATGVTQLRAAIDRGTITVRDTIERIEEVDHVP